MSDTTDLISSAYTSGNVTFAGLGSGTDFDTLIEGLVEAESTHLNQLKTWKATWEEKITAFQELNTAMLSLKTTLEGMDTMNEFLTKAVSSTASSLVTATADSTAETGTHKIIVNQLAQNKIMVNNTGYAASTTVVNSSGSDRVLQYVYEGTTYNITVPNGTTLEGLVNLINNQPANPGVKAMAISNGTQYYLQFRGLDLGSTATLTIGAGTTLTGYGAADWTTSQANQNSEIRVDGWPAASWISNPSNTITNAIPGLTLNLKDADPGTTVTLTTDVDQEAVLENVRTFVEQMNTVRSKIQELTKFDDTNQTGSILTGNYGVGMISQNLKDIVASKGVGFISYNTLGLTEDAYTSLGQLGITTDATEGSATFGLLVLDEEILTEALTDDPTAVAKLFSADYVGESKSPSFTYLSHIDGTTQAGEYSVQVTVASNGSGIASATINGHPALISSAWEITGASGTAEAGLAIRLDTHTAGSTYQGVVTLKLGKTGELAKELKDLTNSTDGPLAILEDNYKDITDSIDDKIAYEEDRLSKYESNLKDKFSRLDTLLGYYEQIASQLTSSIDQLSSSNS
ncbi:MAG TPA: flagellar hook protein [Desulfovibrio sp.]|mgnify:CR=1 FL=1|nr:flagellar hook protein [Desulfovibrio sp.]